MRPPPITGIIELDSWLNDIWKYIELCSCKIATGTYTGNAAATQATTGVGFQPRLLIIDYPATAGTQMGIKNDQMGTKAKIIHSTSGYYEDDHIISLDSDGFTVGDGTGGVANVMNVNAITYTYVCFG